MSLYDSVSEGGGESDAGGASGVMAAPASASDDSTKKAGVAIVCVLAVLGYWQFGYNAEDVPSSPPPSSFGPLPPSTPVMPLLVSSGSATYRAPFRR